MLKLLHAAAADQGMSRSTPPKAAPQRPGRLGRRTLTAALPRLRGPVQRCLTQFGFGAQTVHVRLTIQGATGRISAARLLGRHAESPAGRCAARGLRGLKIAPFTSAHQAVTLPLRIR